MKNWNLLSAALGLLSLCAVSCRREGANSNPAAVAAVKTQMDELRDSVAVKWQTMTAADDQKITLTRLLLKELQPLPGQDAAQLQAFGQANDRLAARRYDQRTMVTSARIDAYDAAQDSLLQRLLPIAAPNGAAPSENARNFVEGIQQLDARVVGDRVKYDRAAQSYNNYLRLHQAELQALGGQYAELKRLPLFTIGAE